MSTDAAQRDPAHDHDHGHQGGHGHAHAVAPDADRRRLTVTFALLGGFLLVEVVVGIIAGSLALLSDAAHMLTDVGAIAFALVAMSLAQRPARGHYTFGLKRTGILSAFANGLTLAGLGLYLAYEGVRRLFEPPEVEGLLVIIIGVVGIVVNVAATWTLAKANRSSLNVEGAFQHVLNDLFAFIGTTIAGVVIVTTGFYEADSIAALVVAALMLKSGIGLVRESTRVLLEAAPRGIDPDRVRADILGVTGVADVEDLHVWEIASGFPALAAHVLLDEEADADEPIHDRIATLLHERFDIDHSTLQLHRRQHAERHAVFLIRGCVPPAEAGPDA